MCCRRGQRSDWTLRRGDRIVMCGFGGPVVTRVRELLTPRPLREMRIKTDYLHHQEVHAAQGIKICANHLEGVVAGSACCVPYADVPYDLEVLKEDVMGDLTKLAKAASEVNGGIGVYAMASTLGSLEALLEFLKTSKIPVSAVNIGPIHKKDVIKASIMLEHKPEYATILAFDVNLTKEGADMAKEMNVKVFTAEIIYHLFDKFTAYMADVRKEQQAKAALVAVFPCVCEISSAYSPLPSVSIESGKRGPPYSQMICPFRMSVRAKRPRPQSTPPRQRVVGFRERKRRPRS